jgi:hypothetical protein
MDYRRRAATDRRVSIALATLALVVASIGSQHLPGASASKPVLLSSVAGR